MKLTGKSKWAKLLTASLILSATSACETDGTVTVPTNGYCAITKPITYSTAQDSALTVAEIEKHNSTYACVCENDCPNKLPNPRNGGGEVSPENPANIPN